MSKKSNIVFQYFKKESADRTIIIQFDPIRLSGAKLTVAPNGDMELEEMDFDSDLAENLKKDGFQDVNPFEFHILINGLR